MKIESSNGDFEAYRCIACVVCGKKEEGLQITVAYFLE
jgi:hypothetical protein